MSTSLSTPDRSSSTSRSRHRRARLAVTLAVLLVAIGAALGGASPVTAAAVPHAVHIYHPVDGTVVPWNDIDLLIWSEPSGASFSCTLDGVALASCRSMTSFHAADGAHTLVVTGRFADGTTASATSHFTADGPKLAVTSPTANTNIWPNAVDVNAAVTVSSSPDVWTHYAYPDFTYSCQLDNGPATPCTFPFHYGNLGQGQHTVRVIATDQASLKTVAGSSTFSIVKPKIYYPSTGTVVPTNQVSILLQRAGTEVSCTEQVDSRTPVPCLTMAGTWLANGWHDVVMKVTYAGGIVVTDTSHFLVAG